MTDLLHVADAFQAGKEQYEAIMRQRGCSLFQTEEVYNARTDGRIAVGENLHYMKFLLEKEQMAGKIQLIYADPPFFSDGQYQASVFLNSRKLGKSPVIRIKAYEDRWGQDLEGYLRMLTVRFFLMRELLAETGCLWVHLDWHVVHYVKMILDQIFGQDHFINEVIWTYKSGGASKRSFSRKHDTLLLYGKSRNYFFQPLTEKSYNRGMKPYRFSNVQEFQDERGWYTLVNMKDVWAIDMVGRTAKERTGYATQKPEKLLERIVASCSRPGDLCADFFAGSGTLGAVCSRLGRRWIMCDAGALSAANQIDRLTAQDSGFLVERAPEKKETATIKLLMGDGEIELLEYEAKVPDGTLEQRKEVEKYLEKDSISLVRFWSVDFDFDGKVHRTNGICRKSSLSFPAASARPGRLVSIMGYDVFGNRFSQVTGG